MGRFKKGERVRVTIEGTVNTYHEGGGPHEAIYVTSGNGHECHYILLGIAGSLSGTVSVESLDPADWPPQVGDIWEANGQEWFACRRHDDGALLIKPDDGGGMWDTKTFKSLNPVLVRRRG